MKKILSFPIRAFLAFCVMIAVVVTISTVTSHVAAQSALRAHMAGADRWDAADGTSAFTLDSATASPVIVSNITTRYTGMSTNVALYGGATNSYRLVIHKGLVVGVSAY